MRCRIQSAIRRRENHCQSTPLSLGCAGNFCYGLRSYIKEGGGTPGFSQFQFTTNDGFRVQCRPSPHEQCELVFCAQSVLPTILDSTKLLHPCCGLPCHSTTISGRCVERLHRTSHILVCSDIISLARCE
jgi:hypothetical protein